jgi:maltose/moltooligosaccharide transporter
MLPIQQRLQPLFYGILSLPSSAMGFALSVQIAAMSWILTTKYQLDIHEVGLVWAAGPIAGIFGQVIFGIVSDKVWFWGGRRRPFILIGGVMAALSLLALPNVDIVSAALGIDGLLTVAVLVALTLDLSINVGFNPTRTIIADVTPEGQARTKGYTWMQTISGTFGMSAYVISAVFDNYTLIYAGAVMVLLMSVIPPFFIEEPRQLDTTDTAQNTVPRRSFATIMMSILPLWGFLLYAAYRIGSRLLGLHDDNFLVEIVCFAITAALIILTLLGKEKGKSRQEAGLIGFRKVLAAHAFTWIGIQTMFVYMFAFVQQRMPELDNDAMGKVVSISFLIFNGVAALLPALVLEPLTRNFGRVRTHTLSIASMALAYGGIWLLGYSPTSIYLIFGMLGIGWAATVSLPFAIMSQKVDKSLMGLYMGLFNLSVVLPQLVASLGIGQLIEQSADRSVIFIVCTVCLALSALAWSFVKEDEGAAVANENASGH